MKLIASIFALAGLALPVAAQELVTNGSFETPVVPTVSVLGIGLLPGAETFNAGSTGIPGFTVPSGSVSIVDAGGTLAGNLGLFTPAPGDGNQYAVLNGLTVNALGIASIGGTGTLSQAISGLTSGSTYQLSFQYAPLSVNAVTGTPILQVTTTNSSNSTGPGAGLLTLALSSWQTETFDFTATGTSTVLSFSEPNYSLNNTALVGLDGVSLTPVPVPEPAQYAATACGFLALLALGRLWQRRAGGTAHDDDASLLAV